MPNWIEFVLVGYISFSLGIIAGCMIMTKGDRVFENDNMEKETIDPFSKEISTASDHADELISK